MKIKDSEVLTGLDMAHSAIYEMLLDCSNGSRITNKTELECILLLLKVAMEELETLGFEYKR